MRSFLLDAGAEYNGYAAGSNPYLVGKSDNDYVQLVKDVNDEQLAEVAHEKTPVTNADSSRYGEP